MLTSEGGIVLNNGYVTLKDVKVGTGSFSVALWLKASPITPVDADPSIISNKNWQEGVYKGFILSYKLPAHMDEFIMTREF